MPQKGRQWNSTLPRRSNPMARSSLKRQPKHSAPHTKQPPVSSRKLGAGKKTREWSKVRRVLKDRFQMAGITTCEIQYPGCWKDNGLGFAHSLKRRNITSPELLDEVILACNVCHDKIEAWPEDAMTAFVRGIIAGRGIPV